MKYTAGEEITNPKLNDRRGYDWTGASVRRVATQAITSGTTTKVQLNSEVYDKGNNFDAVTNFQYTVPEAGQYLILASVDWISPADQNQFVARVYKNTSAGTEIACDGQSASGTEDIFNRVHALADCVANDTIQLYVEHNAGVDRTLNSACLFIIRIA